MTDDLTRHCEDCQSQNTDFEAKADKLFWSCLDCGHEWEEYLAG